MRERTALGSVPWPYVDVVKSVPPVGFGGPLEGAIEPQGIGASREERNAPIAVKALVAASICPMPPRKPCGIPSPTSNRASTGDGVTNNRIERRASRRSSQSSFVERDL